MRCDGTAMDVGGTRRGGFSLVTNRTCTCLEASDPLPVDSISSLTLFPSLSLRLAWEEVKLGGGGKRQSSERRRERFKLGLGFWEGMTWFSIGPFLFLKKVSKARSIRWNKVPSYKIIGPVFTDDYNRASNFDSAFRLWPKLWPQIILSIK